MHKEPFWRQTLLMHIKSNKKIKNCHFEEGSSVYVLVKNSNVWFLKEMKGSSLGQNLLMREKSIFLQKSKTVNFKREQVCMFW